MPAPRSWLRSRTRRLVRRAADAVLVRYAHHRTVALDRMDAASGAARHPAAARPQGAATRGSAATTTSRASRRSPTTRPACRVRDYEWFWNTYWKDAYPRLDDVTWPGKIPYYALSSRHDERRDEVHPRVARDGEVEPEGRASRRSRCSGTRTRPRSSSPASSSSSAAAPTCASRPTAASRAT